QRLSRRDALREVIAAAMCGRWRNGVPLALSPDTPNPSPDVSRTKFDYTNFDDDGAARCPYGAHIRRCNPRGGQIVQRVANHSRRLHLPTEHGGDPLSRIVDGLRQPKTNGRIVRPGRSKFTGCD